MTSDLDIALYSADKLTKLAREMVDMTRLAHAGESDFAAALYQLREQLDRANEWFAAARRYAAERRGEANP